MVFIKEWLILKIIKDKEIVYCEEFGVILVNGSNKRDFLKMNFHLMGVILFSELNL